MTRYNNAGYGSEDCRGCTATIVSDLMGRNAEQQREIVEQRNEIEEQRRKIRHLEEMSGK